MTKKSDKDDAANNDTLMADAGFDTQDGGLNGDAVTPAETPAGGLVNSTQSMVAGSAENATPQSTPEGGFPRTEPGKAALEGPKPSEVSAAAVFGEDTVGVLESRDETHDSIDPATGTLTAEAVAKRQAMATEN